MRARPIAIGLGIPAALLAFAAPANASYTLGAPDMNATPAGVPGSDATLFQESDPGSTLTGTGTGVVVAFRARFTSPAAPQPISFRIMRPELGNRFTMIGSTPSTVPAAPSSGLVEQPARAPIRAGELIGLDAPSGVAVQFTAPVASGTTIGQISPIVGDGAVSSPATPAPVSQGRLFLNATVEPDEDGDGWGDETQDRCPGTAGPADGCVAAGPASNEFTFGQVKRNKRRGTAKVRVKVADGPGSLELSRNRRVRADREVVAGDGPVEVTLKVRPRGRAARKLARTGKVAVDAEVTYTPDGGEPKRKSERLRLIRK